MQNFTQFLNRSPTAYQAATEIAKHLDEADFTPLEEGERWSLQKGQGYYIMREDTLVAAFRLPKKTPRSALLLASHTDSPALKIKPKPEIVSHDILQLGTEPYGGPLLHTWLDRDLAIAGRIVVNKGETKNVFLEEYPLFIPSLAIHLDKTINEKGLIVHKQDHLKAVLSTNNKIASLEALLHKHQPFQKLLSFDLFLVPTEKAAFVGYEHECISSYRLDNLTSAFASLYAMTNVAATEEVIQMALFWDHEEIGSKTFAGADSIFAHQILERICHNCKMDQEDYYRLKSQSLCISCDVGHAFNPNFQDKYDPQNATLMGKGPAVKFSSRYATTGATHAAIVRLAEKKKIPLQTFASKSDISSGSTVGALMAATLGMPTVDLGISCLAMHSVRETVSSADQKWLCELLKSALQGSL